MYQFRGIGEQVWLDQLDQLIQSPQLLVGAITPQGMDLTLSSRHQWKLLEPRRENAMINIFIVAFLILLQSLGNIILLIHSEIQNTTIYRLVDDEQFELSYLQYICFLALNIHSWIVYTISDTFLKIFHYRVTFSKFYKAKWYIKPILLIVNAICLISSSLMYSLFYLPQSLVNSAATKYLEQWIGIFPRS